MNVKIFVALSVLLFAVFQVVCAGDNDRVDSVLDVTTSVSNLRNTFAIVANRNHLNVTVLNVSHWRAADGDVMVSMDIEVNDDNAEESLVCIVIQDSIVDALGVRPAARVHDCSVVASAISAKRTITNRCKKRFCPRITSTTAVSENGSAALVASLSTLVAALVALFACM